ncbi:MAG: 2-phospho-L-lactate guanylyltransferase [Candidatus Dormibacteria bacterium]
MRAALAGAYLVIPVKAAAGSKQRLLGTVPDEVRQLVSRALAARVLRCAAQAWVRDQVVVVGGDSELVRLCQRLGLAIVGDPGEGQSEAVRVGQRWSLERGATTLATVAADLPLALPEDIGQLLQHAGGAGPRSLSLVADVSGRGSNGLVLRPPSLDVFRFGPDSSRRHRQVAQELGLRFARLDLPRLAWDVDRLADLTPAGSTAAAVAHPVVGWALGVARAGALSATLGGG